MKIRATPVFLTGFLILFCSARAQFTGSYSITPPAAANYASLSTTPTSYGNWTVTGGSNIPGGLNTTNSGSGSISLSATVVGLSGGNGSTATMLATAATNLSVSFNFSATGVYSSGQFSDGASFLYTTNGGSTWTTVYQTTGAISNGTVASTPVTFLVNAGSQFGFESLAANTASNSTVGAISATVSNFTVSAVPEPSTYAAIFGVGALGLVVYRRRMKQTV